MIGYIIGGKMNQEFDNIKQELKKVKEQNVAHPELGTQNDFSPVQDSNNILISKIEIIVEKIIEFFPELSEGVTINWLRILREMINYMISRIGDIQIIVKKNVHVPDFPISRRNLINDYKGFSSKAENELFEIEQSIRLLDLEKKLADNNKFDEYLNQKNKDISVLETTISEAKAKMGELEDLSLIKTLKESAGTFEKLRSNHSRFQNSWFITLIISSFLILIFVIYLFFTEDYKELTSAALIGFLFRKLLIIGSLSVVFKVALKKYNTERNLKIIYDHRATVLEQYKYFENAIGDDREAKNLFRLEIAKYIFSDPNTGYLNDNQQADVNINPVINLADKLFNK